MKPHPLLRELVADAACLAGGGFLVYAAGFWHPSAPWLVAGVLLFLFGIGLHLSATRRKKPRQP